MAGSLPTRLLLEPVDAQDRSVVPGQDALGRLNRVPVDSKNRFCFTTVTSDRLVAGFQGLLFDKSEFILISIRLHETKLREHF